MSNPPKQKAQLSPALKILGCSASPVLLAQRIASPTRKASGIRNDLVFCACFARTVFSSVAPYSLLQSILLTPYIHIKIQRAYAGKQMPKRMRLNKAIGVAQHFINIKAKPHYCKANAGNAYN